jgi:phosphate transport system substrate-binding protein
MPLHFAEVNPHIFKVQPLDGVMPSAETVSNKQYELIRPLYILVKKAHVKDYWGKGLVSGLREFITEITRESTIGPGGYLTEMGVIPVEEYRRNEIRAASLRLETISR